MEVITFFVFFHGILVRLLDMIGTCFVHLIFVAGLRPNHMDKQFAVYPLAEYQSLSRGAIF